MTLSNNQHQEQLIVNFVHDIILTNVNRRGFMSQYSQIHKQYVQRGRRTVKIYLIEIWHNELGKHQVIRSDDKYVLQRKAQMKMQQWDGMWERKVIAEQKRIEREQKRMQREQKKQYIERQKLMANQLTDDAQNELNSMDNILEHTLTVDDTINWELLKNREEFALPKPRRVTVKDPIYRNIPDEPNLSYEKYNPKLGFFDKLSKSRRQKVENNASERFKKDMLEWESNKEKILKRNQKTKRDYETKVRQCEKEYLSQLKNWNTEKEDFSEKKELENKIIDEKKRLYFDQDLEAILDYCDMVLSNSEYPDEFPQEYQLDFNPETKILVVDYQLPPLDAIPSLREVKYIQTRDEFKENVLPKSKHSQLYDRVLYQITLRSIHELYEADKANALDAIVFNGYVNSIDPATGRETNSCVLSVQANKEEFEIINLANIEAKACFKKLKGVGSSKLHSLTPIPPIVKIDRDDKRFVESYDVGDELDERYNLAAMDWEDFEHLIRELFEQAFSEAGAEVKVTRASRDGGIDAVIFDPDPLRGGKIVVQAKRYTNTVGVSAVRDLYGTLVNEGANKGILVTTSDYGPDAYKFAEGKPLQLLNGSNLLHLLEQHGHKAKIDLKEAKEILNNE